jgi:acetyl-CoA C-acetyltransferase
MREVAVIGIGQTPVSEHWDKSLRVLGGEAILAALEDAELSSAESLYVGNMMSGTANRQQHLGSYFADWVGLKQVEALRIESACSSGAAAFRSALFAVASGEVDSAIALGVEKMTDSPGSEITSALATAADADWEVDQGLSFVALNALIMQRYMHEYGWRKDDFTNFSLNAHANAVHNPNARFQKAITEKQYKQAVMIAEPINVMDASPMGDGSAAAVLVPIEKYQPSKGRPVIRIVGSGAATDALAVDDRPDPLWLSAAESSAKQAFSQSNLSPEDVNIFEAHDAFTIMAALSLEASGFIERGQGPRCAVEGEIFPSGRIPIATMGGLKARGHPVGATGMYQIVELIQQLRYEAGETQVTNACVGMTQNIGGSGSNIISHIFRSD